MGSFAGQGLAGRRGERLVFSGLSFTLESGDALVLAGRNGSGKSTLLRLLAGFGRPESGALLWDAAPIAGDAEAHHARLHYVGHQDALKPALTVAETLRFWARIGSTESGGLDVAAALAPLDLAGLIDLPCRFLSSGQRRRLALSRLLTWSAPLWLLDEPTVGLDSVALQALSAVIARHRAQGGMVVLSTHQGILLPGAVTLSLDDFPPRRVPPGGAADADSWSW